MSKIKGKISARGGSVSPKASGKVLCAMSGGVDSSVAAALLVAQGYDVTGAFMVNYEDEITQINSEDYADSKCWVGDYQDALRVAAKLGIPLMRLDFQKEYKKTVLDYMYEEYRKGRTPNPDVLCNKFIKFGAWLDKARALGFDFLATGHYARLVNSPLGRGRPARNALACEAGGGGLALMSAKDANKDQTYFLHQLNQAQLKHVLFPIGEYIKPEVRKLARKFNLPNADKEESMGICFVGEVPMKEFLQKEIKSKKGKILLSPSARPARNALACEAGGGGVRGGGSGEAIGEHEGLPFYTIGQRQGLSFRAERSGVEESLTPRFKGSLHSAKSLGRDDKTKPLYVVAKNQAKNELIVGYENDQLLYKKEIEATNINWISGQPPKFPFQCEARLRHRQPLQKCKVIKSIKSKVKVEFSTPQRAVTPGQFAVFYKDGECLGGGVIVS